MNIKNNDSDALQTTLINPTTDDCEPLRQHSNDPKFNDSAALKTAYDQFKNCDSDALENFTKGAKRSRSYAEAEYTLVNRGPRHPAQIDCHGWRSNSQFTKGAKHTSKTS